MVNSLCSVSDRDEKLLSNYHQQAAFVCSQATRVGVVGGVVALSVSSFFGYDCLYPATFAGFSFCAWAGTELSQTPIQEILNDRFRSKLLSFLPQRVRECLNNFRWKNSLEWKEFMRWDPVSSEHTLLPPKGFFGNLKSIFTSSPKESTEVRAFTNGVSLKYETLNLHTNVKRSGPIQFDCPIEEMIEILKNCFVALEDNGVPIFSQSFHTLKITSSSNSEAVRLLLRSRNMDLIWNIYDYRYFDRVISTQKNSLSYRCSKATRAFFKSRRTGSVEDRILLARECVLYSYNSNEIILEPIHESSGFNDDIFVSKFMWAVTLIRNKGPLGNHAEIIIEGINNGFFPHEEVPIGKYFVFLADLPGYRIIKKQGEEHKIKAIRTKLTAIFNLRYEERSVVWKRPSDLVQNMILNIIQERDHPSEGFSIFGRHSVFASKEIIEDSCITWAIEQLSIANIVLEQKNYTSLFTNTSLFTKFKPSQQEKTLDTFFYFFVDDSKLI